MGKVVCRCGETISDISPNENQVFFAHSEEDQWPLIVNLGDANKYEHPLDVIGATLNEASFPFYRCAHCQRLLVFWDAGKPFFSSYRLENDQ